MNAYEIMLILDPELAEERQNEIVARMRELIETRGGSWVGQEPWGRRKLAPVISPGKTIEGAIGGLIVAPIAGALLGRWAMPEVFLGAAAVLALGLALFGMAGDLFESLIKRSAGAKDSSSLIPGHGGVLDRIDAYLFAAPVFYLFLRFIA